MRVGCQLKLLNNIDEIPYEGYKAYFKVVGIIAIGRC